MFQKDNVQRKVRKSSVPNKTYVFVGVLDFYYRLNL